MGPRGEPDAELRFGSHPRDVRRARALADHLTRGRLDDERRADLLVVVSELVTNAIRHTHHGGTLRLCLDDEEVRVEVLVALLATAWGVDIHADGKTVWAVCPSHAGSDVGCHAR